MIKITDEDINYAEGILLKPGQNFDLERRLFIRNLCTIDLQAVPGSGKTTALLAKLLIIEKRLPLSENRGILVLSHTNAAIDEIKGRIGHHCPKLFSYPNFVGTIQSFVDTFLAIPAYVNKFKRKPVCIDNEIYSETIEKLFKYGKKGFKQQEKNNALYYNSNFNVLHTFRFSFGEGVFTLKKSINGNPLEIKTPSKKLKPFTSQELKRISEWLWITKMNVMEAGILHFDDAYALADVILYNIKGYKELIQKRFQYVFVDEMQDMEQHQFQLLETLFANDNSKSIYQRLGDVNQSIFPSSISTIDIWRQRKDKLFLKGSHRLSKPIANLVSKLSIAPSELEGRGLNNDGTEITIKPLLIIYDSKKVTEVIPTFSTKLNEYIKSGLVPDDKSNAFHAIGWRKNHDHDNKICLSDYHPDLKGLADKSEIDFETLEDYFHTHSNDDYTLANRRKSLLNAFVKILRIEGVKDEVARSFTITRMVRFIRLSRSNEYPIFNLNIYNWSVKLIDKDIKSIKSEIQKYIPDFLNLFNCELRHSADFVSNPAIYIPINNEEEEAVNYYDKDGFKINVGTVHSVKGQTHIATLYLETFFSTGYGSYESQRLRNQFIGTHISETIENHKGAGLEKIKQSAKMAYVGFSRPTHLLAFAVEESRFESFLKHLNKKEWDIIELKKTAVIDS
ncbi:UvrD-helicase domain-containing protein [Gillisia sp. Hel_I_29]|uniref:UvrD-helicase domain-containing protein n=1 Tax=Gillisia sp. Hel_I_29 TaxID=1249975 RepID=UPI00054EC6D3|nr:UvrD-helicase domain-containing protein [Gillisia sp. Hel_I_29]